MKHPSAALACISLCCSLLGAGCAEDGSRAEPLDYPSKGGPPEPCPDPGQEQLSTDAATVFGVDAVELLAGVQPRQPQPLFWVPYDGVGATAYGPGVSTTSVTLTLSLREGEPVQQRSFSQPDPVGYWCPSSVELPVRVTLQSADGALDQQLDTVLEFWSRSNAGLGAFVPTAELAGSLDFAQGEGQELLGLHIGASLWPGGSRGSVAPELRVLGSIRAPRLLPRGALGGSSESATPSLPQRWNLLAVWPRREACSSGTVYDAADQPDGWSAQQAARELTSHGAGTLVTAEGSTPVQFTIEPPTGLVCLEGDLRQSPELSFEVTGRLAAVASEPPAPLEHLDASARFLLRVRSARDVVALQSVRWEPQPVPFLSAGQPLADFTATTGLELTTATTEPLFVWSWQGASKRSDDGRWTTTGQFLVQAAHEEEGKICQGMFEPPAGTRPAEPVCMTFPFVEPGATLLSAELAP